MFSRRAASEIEHQKKAIRKVDKKMVLRVFFPKVFGVPFKPGVSRGDLIAGYPYFGAPIQGATGAKTGVAELALRMFLVRETNLATPVLEVIQREQGS